MEPNNKSNGALVGAIIIIIILIIGGIYYVTTKINKEEPPAIPTSTVGTTENTAPVTDAELNALDKDLSTSADVGVDAKKVQ